MRFKKKILVIFNEIPCPLIHGGNIRVYHLLKELSKYYDVNLLALPSKRGHIDLSELKKFCKVIIAPCFIEEFFGKPSFFLYFIKAVYFKFERLLSPFKSKLLLNHNYQTFCLNKMLKKILKKENFEYIEVEHSYLGYVIENINTKAVKILDFHNVHSYMKNNPRERRLIKKYERDLVNKFDLAICCSEIDKNRLENLGYKKIVVVPNGIDTDYFREVPYSRPSSLLFVGDLTYSPNREGIKYFFKEIYPLLHKSIQINIIGDYSKNQFKKERKLKNVRFHGFVEDIRPYFTGSVFICPLLNGGGTRIKILTAFSAGVPVISTSKGAEGIECNDKKNIYIVDNPKLFAEKIKNIFNDCKTYNSIRKNARELVESKYDWEKIIEKYHKDLKKLKDRK